MSIKKLIALPLHAILFLPLIGLASCGQGTSSAGGVGVQIDWVNFIRFNGITYLAESHGIAIQQAAVK